MGKLLIVVQILVHLGLQLCVNGNSIGNGDMVGNISYNRKGLKKK